MKKLVRSSLLAAAVLLAGAVHAAPASVDSVEALLVATRAHEAVDLAQAGMEKAVRDGMTAAMSGTPPSDAQKRLLEVMPGRLAAAMQPSFGWEALKPAFVQLYLETFSQEEVEGLLAFYRGPIGASLVAKMPTVVQRTMQITQARLMEAMPRIQAEMKAAIAELQNAR